jgi:hypothetical protein
MCIDIDISDGEYTGGDSHFYGQEKEGARRPPCLANHDESMAIDFPLCTSGDP